MRMYKHPFYYFCNLFLSWSASASSVIFFPFRIHAYPVPFCSHFPAVEHILRARRKAEGGWFRASHDHVRRRGEQGLSGRWSCCRRGWIWWPEPSKAARPSNALHERSWHEVVHESRTSKSSEDAHSSECFRFCFDFFERNVNTSNFGPHGNFGPLFQKGLLSSKRVLHKNEENKSCRKTLDLRIRFCSFPVDDSSKEATQVAKKGPKFPCGPKLEAFTVVLFVLKWHADLEAVDLLWSFSLICFVMSMKILVMKLTVHGIVRCETHIFVYVSRLQWSRTTARWTCTRWGSSSSNSLSLWQLTWSAKTCSPNWSQSFCSLQRSTQFIFWRR